MSTDERLGVLPTNTRSVLLPTSPIGDVDAFDVDLCEAIVLDVAKGADRERAGRDPHQEKDATDAASLSLNLRVHRRRLLPGRCRHPRGTAGSHTITSMVADLSAYG
jgi:hypothetical protein